MENDAVLPRKLLTYLRLSRFPSSALLGGLTLAASLNSGADRSVAVLAALSIFFIAAGGFAFNDVADIERDRINTPRRPLPSGALTATEAILISLSCFAVGFLISLLCIGKWQAIFAVVYVISLLVYSKISEVLPLYKNLYVASLITSFAFFGRVDRSGLDSCSFSIAAMIFLFILGRELLGDLFDQEGDRLSSRLTIPLLWGERVGRHAIIVANVLLMPIIVRLSVNCGGSGLFLLSGIVAVFFNLGVAVVGVSDMERRTFKICLEVEKQAMALTVAFFFLS